MNKWCEAPARIAACVSLAVIGMTGSAQAAEHIHIDADEVFDGQSTFTSNLEGCEEGVVSNGGFQVAESRRFGKFNGFKVFECADGGVFVVRLAAKFDETGSTGTWTIVDGWDGYEQLHGAGTLVGTRTPTGINDVYDGTLRP